MGIFPNVLSMPWPNFVAFFLLSCFVQLGVILLFQLVTWSSPLLFFFPKSIEYLPSQLENEVSYALNVILTLH